MTLLAVERIKLFSTRSPWWSSLLAVVLVTGMTALVVGTWPDDAGPVPFDVTSFFTTFGMVVVMVMATVAITSEYRFGTVRTTFQAVPRRWPVLLAKTAVVAMVAALVGLVAAFAAWSSAWLIDGGPSLTIDTGAEWRAVAGTALVYALAAVIAVAVGVLVRQTAGAVSLLLVWVLLVENLVALIPRAGDDIQRYLPFVNTQNFLVAGVGEPTATGGAPVGSEMPFGPWGSLVYVTAIAAGLLAIGLVVAQRRDA
ncbi:MAG TPA: ABC transporter permease subunit [Pseudonocardia sp.]|nr:ABC transporter permease subunit [Pseudonocardia sp.]